jgi:hypothetical protein
MKIEKGYPVEKQNELKRMINEDLYIINLENHH